MTVFGKKKDTSKGSKDTVSKSGNPTSAAVASHNPVEVEVSGGNEPHSLSIPAFEVQPENLSLRADRLCGSGLSVASLWTNSQGLSSLALGSGSDLRVSQPHYDTYEYLDNGSGHHGKRRRRVSPMRTARNKLSRVERDRSANSSPSGTCSSAGNVPTTEVVSTICAIPIPPGSPEVSACNSEDEYEGRPQAQLTEEEWVERERRFEKKIRKKGLIIKQMGEDGACLFRAVADQVYGDQEMHNVVRKHCMDYIAANGDYYSQYVTEDFNHYVSRKRLDHVHGNHIEIQAMSETYNRTIEVFCYGTEPINCFHGAHQTDNAPIRLSYHRGVHYNSLVDPFKATIGVGLGLPGNHPGLADKNLLSEASRQSEDIHIEQAMLEDKLRATDWEATNEAIEEQVARESYLQWLKDNERRNRAARPATASSSSATVTSSATSEIRSPRSRSHGGNISPIGSPFRGDAFRNSPSRHSPPPSMPGPSKKMHSPTLSSSPPLPPVLPAGMGSGNSPSRSPSATAFGILESAPYVNQLPKQVFDLNEWDDAGILAQVLAASQQEYFDSLKRARESSGAGSPERSASGGNGSGASASAEGGD